MRLQQAGRWLPGLIVLAALLAMLALLRPLPAWTPPALDLRATPTSQPAPPIQRTAEAFAVLWQRDLRQNLIPAPAAAPAPVAEQTLALRLEGTALDGQQQWGLFRLPDNRTVVKPVGATLDGFEIVAVSRGRATLRRGGQVYELKVPWYDRLARQMAAEEKP